MQLRISLLTLALSALACSSTASAPATPVDGGVDAPAQPSRAEATADRLTDYLLGRFDSKDQSVTDPTYFAIQLQTCRVEAKPLGPRVIYVEQARMDTLSAPYRQRLYVIEPVDDDNAISRVLEFADPKPWIGACKRDIEPITDTAIATPRPGCGVQMHWTGDHFEGATGERRWDGDQFAIDPQGTRCQSMLNGATYATTDVSLTSDGLKSWDRGWDATDKQVWGATKGGYVFVRRAP
jgi:CpeT protein